jgi:glutaredoxin
MNVTLQHFEDCPHWRKADRLLNQALAEEGIDAEVTYQVINSNEEAVEHGFKGSPTILIDGVDPFFKSDAPVGLGCRIYMTEDGPTGSPSLGQIRRALTTMTNGQ